MKLNIPGFFLLGAMLLTAGISSAQDAGAERIINKAETPSARSYLDFDGDWRFNKGEFANAMMPEFNDSAWRRVSLPHDWSIEGPFGAEYASGTGFAPGGIAFYRKHFRLDQAYKDKLVAIEFDGVYNNAEVWINGQLVGGRPYGYASFQFDLTPYLKFGTAQNVLAVRVDHSKFADSRWYTGSGIYRHVRLRITDKLHIGHWGTYVTTPQVKEDIATIRIATVVENGFTERKNFTLQSEIVGPDGQVVASRNTSANVDANAKQSVGQQIDINHPQLWSLDSPALYRLNSRLKVEVTVVKETLTPYGTRVESKVVDETSTPFGIRTIRFDPDQGFFLNNKSLKIKGVCLHHDAGCLGAAVPEKVLERRLRLLKDLGVNAIRTSHNPPAPELLDLCDRLGLLVKDEAFDEFTPPKNKWITGWNDGVPGRYGYGEVFDQWSVSDMRDMMLRDRNHPCIIMWSIGNEFDYANDPFSHPVLGEQYKPENPSAEKMVLCAKPLIETAKKMDPTRPVTAALANVAMSDAVGLGEMLDIVGYNYQEQRYSADHKKYPKRFIFGSENHHTYSAWTAVRDNDYISGQFLWTGIDYLGEARRWPNRASSFGLLDLCGFKKPLGWFRQSLWNEKPMVYICASSGRGGRQSSLRGEEHWNWPQNSTVTVHCFTNCPEAVLTLNDQPIGTKRLADAVEGVLSWRVPYQPGVLKVDGQNGGKMVCEYVLKTAGPASRIELSPDVIEMRADGQDICHLEFKIVDAQGVRAPDAGNELTFSVDGPAEIIGIGSGDQNNTEDCKDLKHKAYQGRGLAIVRSKTEAGKITLQASSSGLESATANLTSR